MVLAKSAGHLSAFVCGLNKMVTMVSNLTNTIAIILLNMGGPDSLSAVEPFLRNLFSDRDIIQLPGPPFLQPYVARIIAAKRAPKSRKYYEMIGGKSPLTDITLRQAEKLESTLIQSGMQAECFVAMRYWHPFASEAVKRVREAGIKRVVALSLYPHYSQVTGGSSIKDLRRSIEKENADFELSVIDRFYDFPAYIACLQARIEAALDHFTVEEKKGIHIIFSAHSVPQKLIARGDPYLDHTTTTFRLVTEKFRTTYPCYLAFQSRSGPVKWLEPDTAELLDQLLQAGKKEFVIVPVSFVSDHVETLYEIDILYRSQIEKQGGKLVRTESLNDADDFIAALASLVRKHLLGCE
jgi:ferrochelatase